MNLNAQIWFNYSVHLCNTFESHPTSKELADVTLVCADQKEIKAHWSVLSNCSPMMKNLLKFDTREPVPVIYLDDVKYSEMQAILKYNMYVGQTTDSNKKMVEFWKINDIDIEDLTNLDTEAFNGEEKSMDIDFYGSENKQQNETSAKEFQRNEYGQHIEPPLSADAAEYVEVELGEHVDDDNTELVNEITSNSDNGKEQQPFVHDENAALNKFVCNECDRWYTNYSNLRKHKKSVHEGVRYNCSQCEFQAKYSSDLKRHIQCKHEGLRYSCSKCDHKATQPNDLKKHISAVHEKNSTIYVCGQESILGLCQRRFSSKSHMNKHRQSNKHRYL